MNPLNALALLLPALVPSWRFFDAVTASPRLDWRWRAHQDAAGSQWQEWRARPERLGIGSHLLRFLWNPAWNETLYSVSLCERLLAEDNSPGVTHSERELERRVARTVSRADIVGPAIAFQLRVRLVERAPGGRGLREQCAYLGPWIPLQRSARG